MQKLLVTSVLLLFLNHLSPAPVLAQVDPVPLAPKPAVEGPATQVEGSWRLTPLVVKGATAPEANGQFQEFGQGYAMENMLVFWARFGPGEKDWGLFSLKDGKLSKVLLEDVEFVAPDSRKIRVRRADQLETRFHAGKRILYISNKGPDHVYGWDGERLVRVLCAGDQLDVSGARYTVKRATVLDVGVDGRALIYYDANKPQHVNGWVLHDGTGFVPLWKEGDPLPGTPGVQIKNLSAGYNCYANCVGAPRVLEDGSILATLEVTGAPYDGALFHIARERTVKIIEKKGTLSVGPDLGAQTSSSVYLPSLGDLPVARADSFIMHLREGRVDQKTLRVHANGRVGICENGVLALLFYHQGKSEVETCAGLREAARLGSHGSKAWTPYDSVALGPGMFLAAGLPHLVFTVTATRSTLLGALQNKRLDFSFPGLYFWDGNQLSAVPWETVLGDAALSTLSKTGKVYPGPAPPKVIELRRVTRPVSGIGVLLPAGGPSDSRWFISSDSTDGKLVRPPRFQVADRIVTVADVLAWRTPEEALVDLEDGFFLLAKSADAK